MEILHILLFVLSSIPFLYLFLEKFTSTNNSSILTGKFPLEKERLPPGRTGWPVLGETLDYYFKFRRGMLYKFVTDRMNKYSSKVFRTSLIGQPMAILCNAEGNKFLFSNESKLVQVWWPNSLEKLFPKSDNEPSYEYSKSKRKFLSMVLQPDALREYVGIMDAVMKKHLQTDWNCKEVKVGDMSKKYTLSLACKIFLGVDDPKKLAEFSKETQDISTGFHSLPYNLPGSALSRGIKASKIMRKEVEAIVRQRKVELSKHLESSAKDFMSYMLLATDDNGQFFTEGDIASHLIGLVIAGYTTVHGTIALIMKYLSEFPDVYNSVLREQEEVSNSKETKDRLSWEDMRKMKYTWNVACEVLRLLPPGPGSFKEAISDFTYEGYKIPRGWKIHWVFHATHKNPEYFPDPEKFDPSRFQGDGPAPYTFVPFGGGSRICPGNEYARLAILIFVHNVVTKFTWKKLISDERVSYYPYPRPAQGLPIRLHPLNP